jgi:hypothetical protein
MTAVAAFTAGAFWLAWEATRRWWSDGASSTCSSTGEVVADSIFLIAAIAGACAFFVLSVASSGFPRRPAVLCGAASLAVGIGNTLEHCAAEPFFLLYVLGGMGLLAGSAVLAVSLLIRRPWQLGPLAPVCLFVAGWGGLMVDYEHGGAVLIAVGWIAFGVVVLARARSTEDVQRV